jgi:hypothetical protein
VNDAVLDISNAHLRDVIDRIQASLDHARAHGKFVAIAVDLEDAQEVSVAASAYLFHVTRIIQARQRHEGRRLLALGACALVFVLIYGGWLFCSNLVWR